MKAIVLDTLDGIGSLQITSRFFHKIMEALSLLGYEVFDFISFLEDEKCASLYMVPKHTLPQTPPAFFKKHFM